jgi:hypothetical protein
MRRLRDERDRAAWPIGWWRHRRRQAMDRPAPVEAEGPVGYQPVEFLDLPYMGEHRGDPPMPRRTTRWPARRTTRLSAHPGER